MKRQRAIASDVPRGHPAAAPLLRAAAWSRRVLALAACGAAGMAVAWVYPEHRDISMLAVEKLDPERAALLDDLWREARAGHEARLCERAADSAQGAKPACIDWAALSALSGDHSCSSREVTATVLESNWVLSVAAVAAQLKRDLSRITVLPPVTQIESEDPLSDIGRRLEAESARAARVNALRTADIRLQRADPQYATRAGSNNAHFLLARPSTSTSARDYAALTMRVGSEISAVGSYAWYHLSAMQKATRLANEQLSPEVRSGLARAILFDEAFALHFLEDVFAAGHVSGTWGNASQRKGTHDFYNEAGLEVFLWNSGGKSSVLMGDAHMRPEDAERAAVAVATSLEEVLDAAAGRPGPLALPYTPGASLEPDPFDVCRNDRIPDRPEPPPPEAETYWHIFAADLSEVLASTPIPGLGPGLGAMPRFRSELGPFVGVAGAVDGRGVGGGFTTSQGAGFVGGVELSARVGIGLEGVMGESGDGLVFLSLGFRGDSASSNKVSGSAMAQAGGNLTAAVPARTGLTTRLRMPFYLVPGDLILLFPLYLFSPESYTGIAVTAANGGLIPWQAGWATGIGRFQFMLGRELGVTFYGLTGSERVLAEGAAPGDPARVVEYKSTSFDLPILEYRPYRSFGSNQSSTALFQLFAAADVPRAESVVAPEGAPEAELRTVWSFGLRFVFDWRFY